MGLFGEDGEEGKGDEDSEEEPSQFVPHVTKQLNLTPISTPQLAAGVNGIYSGLVTIEDKCVDIIHSQTSPAEDATPPRRNEQWQALLALYQRLLYEHHDFFLASQHPAADGPTRQLAARYSMPARMWKHGIHGFLELLRTRLPDSMHHMLAFIHIAYQILSSLYVTVPEIERTWIECLGNLAWYRMAIEDEDLEERAVWSGIARSWYAKAVDKSPGTGRFYHHLAILTRGYALQQLALYCSSLLVLTPFQNTRDSVLTLLEPTLARSLSVDADCLSLGQWFIALHAMLFTSTSLDRFDYALERFVRLLEAYFETISGRETSKRSVDFGLYVAVANISSLLGYGSDSSRLLALFARPQQPRSGVEDRGKIRPEPRLSEPSNLQTAPGTSPPSSRPADDCLWREWRLALKSLTIVLRQPSDPNGVRHVHVMLVFLWRLALLPCPHIHSFLAHNLPWTLLASYLNHLLYLSVGANKITSAQIPLPERGESCHLPEEYLIRGLKWANGYLPEDWFAEASTYEDERLVELPSTGQLRAERVAWLGVRLAAAGDARAGMESRRQGPRVKCKIASGGAKERGAGAMEEATKEERQNPAQEARAKAEEEEDQRERWPGWLRWNPANRSFDVHVLSI